MSRWFYVWNESLVPVGFFTALAWSSIGCLMPTFLYLKSQRKAKELHIDEEPVTPDQKSGILLQEIKSKNFKVPMDDIWKVPLLKSMFVSTGAEATHMGSLNNSGGAVVGIPYFWRYASVDNVKDPKIVKHVVTDWSVVSCVCRLQSWLNGSPECDKYDISPMTCSDTAIEIATSDVEALNSLKESVILSDSAKKFALIRELEYANTYHEYFQGLIGMAGIGFAVLFACSPIKLCKARKWTIPLSSMPLVMAYQVVCGVVCFHWFRTTIDDYMRNRDKEIDEKVSKMGNEFIHGGIEYYQKLLQKNKAVQCLLGKTGDQLYSENGNIIYSKGRSPHLHLTDRRDTYISLLSTTSGES